jgi:hypothetical protein
MGKAGGGKESRELEHGGLWRQLGGQEGSMEGSMEEDRNSGRTESREDRML